MSERPRNSLRRGYAEPFENWLMRDDFNSCECMILRAAPSWSIQLSSWETIQSQHTR